MIPKKVTVGGKTITTRLVDKKEINNNSGDYDPDKLLISIDQDLAEDEKESTFAHELKHAIHYNANAAQTIGQSKEELLTTMSENIFYQFLKQYTNLFKGRKK